MATVVRYSWLKVINTASPVAPPPPAPAPSPAPSPSPVSFALWTSTCGAVSAFTTDSATPRALAPAPLSGLLLAPSPRATEVVGQCVDCPAQAPASARALFELQAPPLPATGDAWALEAATGPGTTVPPCPGDPQLSFVIHPVEGDYAAAQAWIHSSDGAAWLSGAATALLISCVVQV